MLIIIIVVLCILALHFQMTILRIDRVGDFRLDILNRLQDIYIYPALFEGKPIDKAGYDQMLKIYDSVTFEEMLQKWWKPLRSFYRGTLLESLLED